MRSSGKNPDANPQRMLSLSASPGHVPLRLVHYKTDSVPSVQGYTQPITTDAESCPVTLEAVRPGRFDA